jgi:undecaprenyl-diphosphatase
MEDQSLLGAILLGLIEGLTEFLPVSSTGHLLILQNLAPALVGKRSDLFNIVIQSGAVLAVLPLFKERLATLREWRKPASQQLLTSIVLAFLLTVIGGLIIDKAGLRLPESLTPVAIALILGGGAFLVIERLLPKVNRPPGIPPQTALIAGAGQLVAAIFPGASRSGSSIMAAMLCGTSRSSATEFSFLIGIPTILAASAWKVLKAIKHGSLDEPWLQLAVAWIVAAATSFATVKWLLGYVRNHSFVGFGIYRIALGSILLILALLR